jgi:hypothetical protein
MKIISKAEMGGGKAEVMARSQNHPSKGIGNYPPLA